MRPPEVHVNIDRAADEVFAYMTDLQHLPEWQVGTLAVRLDLYE